MTRLRISVDNTRSMRSDTISRYQVPARKPVPGLDTRHGQIEVSLDQLPSQRFDTEMVRQPEKKANCDKPLPAVKRPQRRVQLLDSDEEQPKRARRKKRHHSRKQSVFIKPVSHVSKWESRITSKNFKLWPPELSIRKPNHSILKRLNLDEVKLDKRVKYDLDLFLREPGFDTDYSSTGAVADSDSGIGATTPSSIRCLPFGNLHCVNMDSCDYRDDSPTERSSQTAQLHNFDSTYKLASVEVEMPVDQMSDSGDTLSDIYQKIVSCICGYDDDVGLVACAACDTFQHTMCYYPDPLDGHDIVDMSSHSCKECSPRPVDASSATTRFRSQLKSREPFPPCLDVQKLSGGVNLIRCHCTSLRCDGNLINCVSCGLAQHLLCCYDWATLEGDKFIDSFTKQHRCFICSPPWNEYDADIEDEDGISERLAEKEDRLADLAAVGFTSMRM